MNRTDPVTTRWAEAFFGLGKRLGLLDELARDVERLDREVRSAAARRFLFDPQVEAEGRRAKLAPVLADLHPLTGNLVHLLFDKRREAVLRGLGDAFHRRLLVERGEMEGVVTSARPLGTAAIDSLAAALSSRLGKTVRLRNEVDLGLWAGVRVVVQNRMLDVSARGRLEGMRRHLMDSALPIAQGA